MTDTPPEPKAAEPSDEELRATFHDAASRELYFATATRAGNRAVYNAGRASRAPEVEALRDAVRTKERYELEALQELDERRAEVEALKEQALHQESLNEVLRSEYDRMCSGMAREQARLKAERDKLHAAMAWRDGLEWRREPPCERVYWTTVDDAYTMLVYRSSAGPCVSEHCDGAPAGRAAALVRLWERVTGGDRG